MPHRHFEFYTDQPIGFLPPKRLCLFLRFLRVYFFQRRSEKLGFHAARAATVSRALRIYHAILELYSLLSSVAFS